MKKNIVNNEIIGAGIAGGVSIGASADSAIGFADGGLLFGLGADIGKEVSPDFANGVTEDNNTSPNRIIYLCDPIFAFGFQATTAMPLF